MNLTRFLNGTANFCMAPEGDGTGGGASGAPSTVTTNAGEQTSASATTSPATVGDVAKAEGEQTSATATVPGVGAQAPATDTTDFRSGWDDTLKNDPSLKDFKDTASLAKALVDTKKLVGQKLGIPGPDATPEAKEAFHEAMGVPKEPDGYEFKAPDLPEGIRDALYSEEHSKEWAQFFKENGVPKDVANKIRDRAFAEMKTDLEGLMAQADKGDEQFGKMAKEIYGDDAKANQALQNVRAMVEKHVPENLKGAMDQLSNTALLIVAAAIRGETMELTGEDKTISRDNGTASDGKTVPQLRDEARQLQALPEYSSPFTAKGKTAHDDVVAKVKAIYDRIGKMGA